jgi:hypothetical protein
VLHRCVLYAVPFLHLLFSQNEQKRIAIIADVQDDKQKQQQDPNAPKQLSTTEAAGALPPPGTSTATAGAGSGLAEALNLAGGGTSGSSGGGSGSTGGGVASVERPAEDATDPELASWVEQLQQEVGGMAGWLLTTLCVRGAGRTGCFSSELAGLGALRVLVGGDGASTGGSHSAGVCIGYSHV